MLAERMIIRTDTSGKPSSFPRLPPSATVEIICLVLDQAPTAILAGAEFLPDHPSLPAKRRPSPKLAGTEILGDLVESVLTETEWEAVFERNDRQIEGAQ